MARRLPLLPIGSIFFLIMLGLTVVGGAFVSFWRGREVYRTEQRNILERDGLLAHTLSLSVNIFLESAATTVSTLASEAEAEPAFSSKNLQPLVERFAERNKGSFISMYVIGMDGLEIADYFPAGRDAAERLAGVGVDLHDRPYFRRAIETGKPVISDAVIGRSTGRPVVVAAAPIFDSHGTIVGLAAGSLDLATLKDLGERSASEAVAPVVIDAGGHVVAHRDAGLVAGLQDVRGLEPARGALSGVSGVVMSYQESDGKTYSAAYAPVPDFGWGVWIAQDSSAFAELTRTILRDTSISLALLILAAGIAFSIASRFLFLPLRRMAAQAERIAGGNLDVQIDLRGGIPSSEVVTLTRRFNEMVSALKASLETKSQFLAVVTHVFRTPITGLKWQIDSWVDRREELNKEQREAWIDCARVIQRLQIGFDNVFVAQEISHKKLRPDMKPLDLAKAVEETIRHLGLLAESLGIKITVKAEASSEIFADKMRIGKVLEAVLSNALFYSRKGGAVSVDIMTKDGQTTLCVKDAGIGINRDEITRIFEPFFRGEQAKKLFTDGTGLGLFIAKAFIELHGGVIKIDSEEDQGTTVTITLPVRNTA